MADGEPAPVDQWAVPRALRGETGTNVEYTLLRKDTGETWVGSYSFSPIRDKNGVIVGSVVVGRDITDTKRAERELRESRERLRTSLAEKEVLLKEIHHRVKNNMQVISSLISLQADELREVAVREALRDVAHRVRSMALVHEKLYQSSDMAQIDFAEYVRSLLSYLFRAHGNTASGIRLVLELDPVLLSVNTAVPCGLIVNELVSNALKHAFNERGEGEVAVSLQSSVRGRVRLCVCDNGRGMPAGFAWREAGSLGLRLVRMLAGQLHATVEASSDGGTCFTVTFGGRKE
jgi:two-component sensor histidine kinase